MSLTQGHDLYAALNESGLKKFLDNVYAARPHYFNYATPGLGGGSPDVSLIPPISVPGSNVGVDCSFELTEPEISFYPVPSPPFPLPVAQNQFGFYTKATA